MQETLNIINGSSILSLMKRADIHGDFLAWNDFLHEGPVPSDLSLEERSLHRTKFIYRLKLAELSTIESTFKKRNSTLREHQKYRKVRLWFEADLYDQLQLLEILSWLATHRYDLTQYTLILTPKYLGELTAHELKRLLRYEQKITTLQFELAEMAWSAFTDTTPLKWQELYHKSTSILPFLKPTIKRMLEEYPSTINGLSRTAHQALLLLNKGEHTPKNIFLKSQAYESYKFMGDLLFQKILDDFVSYNLVESQQDGQRLTLTPLGKELLIGRESWLNLKPIDRWIGGVHLTPDNLWCWNIEERSIKKYYFSKSLSSLLEVN